MWLVIIITLIIIIATLIMTLIIAPSIIIAISAKRNAHTAPKAACTSLSIFIFAQEEQPLCSGRLSAVFRCL